MDLMTFLAGPGRFALGLVGMIVLLLLFERYKTWRRTSSGTEMKDGAALGTAKFVIRVVVWIFIFLGALQIAMIQFARYQEVRIPKKIEIAPSDNRAKAREFSDKLETSIQQGKLREFKELLQDADVNQKVGLSGLHLIQYVSRHAPKNTDGDQMLLMVLEMGANLKLTPEILTRVIQDGRFGVVDELLDAGANANHAQKWQPTIAYLTEPPKPGTNPDYEFPLHSAMQAFDKFGAKQVIAILLAAGANPHSKDAANRTAFEYGSDEAHDFLDREYRKVTRVLVSAPGDEPARDGNTVLTAAVGDRDFERVRHLLSEGANPNLPSPNQRLPLSLALAQQEYDMARHLLQNGADPYLVADLGSSPLHKGVGNRFEGNLNILRSMLALPGNLDQRDKDGHTVLARALDSNKRFAVRYLIAAGANPWLMNEHGSMAFANASMSFQYDAAILPELMDALPADQEGQLARLYLLNWQYVSNDEQALELLDYFLGSGIDVTEVVSYYKQPKSIYDVLSEKFARQEFSRSLSLLEKTREKQSMGETAYLNRVMNSRDIGALEALLGKGADPNTALPGSEFTLLSMAISANWHAGTKLLLENGADPDAPIGKYSSHRALAVAQDNPEILALMKTSQNLPGFVETSCGRTPRTRILLARKLLETSRDGRAHCVSELLEAGAKPDWKDFRGWTAVHHAAYQGHTDVLELLLKNGGDAKAATRFGLNALYWAGHRQMAAYFRHLRAQVHGKEPELLDGEYQQALSAANRIAQLLLEAGADPNYRPNEEDTLLMAAVGNDDVERIRLLDQHGADWFLHSKPDSAFDRLGRQTSSETFRYLFSNSTLVTRDSMGTTSLRREASPLIKKSCVAAIQRNDKNHVAMMLNDIPWSPSGRKAVVSTLLDLILPNRDTQHVAAERKKQEQVIRERLEKDPQLDPMYLNFLSSSIPGRPDVEVVSAIEDTAYTNSRLEILRLVLAAAAADQSISVQRNGALVAAVKLKNLTAARFLLENGLASANAKDYCGNPALLVARNQQDHDMAELLELYGGFGDAPYNPCEWE